MVELSIILGLAIPAVVLGFFAFNLNDEHSVLKMFVGSIAQVFLLGIPLTGYHFARLNGYQAIADYLIYFELVVVVQFVIYVFYLIWIYIEDTGKAMSQAEKEFDTGV